MPLAPAHAANIVVAHWNVSHMCEIEELEHSLQVILDNLGAVWQIDRCPRIQSEPKRCAHGQAMEVDIVFTCCQEKDPSAPCYDHRISLLTGKGNFSWATCLHLRSINAAIQDAAIHRVILFAHVGQSLEKRGASATGLSNNHNGLPAVEHAGYGMEKGPRRLCLAREILRWVKFSPDRGQSRCNCWRPLML